MKNWREYKKFHFIGIGGIGMSALARLLKSQGRNISGSDGVQSNITDSLAEEGILVLIGHDMSNVPLDTDCVVYTLAIDDTNPEFVLAKEKEIPVFTYAEMLGQVSRDLKTIAISGTHGKTTTTAMTHAALREAKQDPTMIVGSLIFENKKKTNYIEGSSDLFVVEACEYKKSFLNLSPTILVITNIEADHLDFYKDLEDVKTAFMELADKVPVGGKIICDFEDENTLEIREKYKEKVINFRRYVDIVPKLKVFGEYNQLNAAAALAVADYLGVNMKKAQKGLKDFRGTWRRMECHGKNKNGALLYDDYAHHPTEIQASLKAIKENFPEKNMIVFFQPHLFSRTKTLFDGFVESLSVAGKVFLLPIYAAREPHDPTITSEMLVEKISNAQMVSSFEEAREEISKRGREDVVITIGAGDIEEVLRDY